MNKRRWVELAIALLLGVLIGYSVAPSQRYTVGQWGESDLYRYDTHTGKTWLYRLIVIPPDPWVKPNLRTEPDLRTWKQIPEPNQVLPLSKEKK